MNFDLDQEHELVRSTVRAFAQERVAPVAEELDRESRFPYDLVGELAELGLMGMTIPEEYGGGGADTLSYAVATDPVDGVVKDMKFDLEGFRNVLKLRAEMEGQWGGNPPPPERYFDPTYYDKAMAGM